MIAGELQIFYSHSPLVYTGVELRPHFLLSQFQLRGSALAAFSGACSVKTEKLVDWEDRLAHDHIEARSMVHFIGEFFGWTMAEGCLFQRLFMSIALEELRRLSPRADLQRSGDDLFWNPAPEVQTDSNLRKLSVSIVTASPVSVLLHVGVNIDAAGAPVPAAGLSDLGIDSNIFAQNVLDRTKKEWADMAWACVKVRPVLY